MQILDRYFSAMRTHQWEDLASCLAEDVHRTGPFMDVVEGRDAYTQFLSEVIPTLENYTLTISKTHTLGEYSAMVELVEKLDLDGVPTEIPEVLIFDLNSDGLIKRVDIYIKQPPQQNS